MEKRQLDFNAPLLSARRYSSPSHSTELRKVLEKPHPARQQSLPVNKSRPHESDEVTKPASVPFHWEQIPGRPKSEVHTPDEPSTTPRLPPGRQSGQLRFNSGDRSNDHNLFRPNMEALSFNDHASLLEKLNESLNCRDDSDSESGEDDFSDALDTLSPNESCSLNYSVSGISGCHSSGKNKPSGTFCVDAQTRDFMMSRFLPAAKAVVLETPNYVVKKPVVVDEVPVLVRKVVSGEIRSSFKKYDCDYDNSNVNLPYNYGRFVDNVESDDEEEEEDCKVNVPVKKSGKAWGILPRFCVKNSLCLLNPLPSMKSKSRATTPRATTPALKNVEVRRFSRKALSGPLDKNACHVPQKKKFYSGLLSHDLSGIENKLHSDSNRSISAGVSPMRRYRSGSISPYRNESPKSPFREGVGFLGVPKPVDRYDAHKIASSRKLFKALQDVSRNQINERGSSGPPPPKTEDSAVEKTLYVDSIQKKEVPKPAFEDVKKQNVAKEHSVSDPPLKSPLPPPLPKSPSESWLWRTLPSISNPFAHSRRSSSHISVKKQGQQGNFADTKWETIVKTSNVRHDHIRYSQELLLPHTTHRQSKS